jgi:Fe2+ or Zn2+ uptake regulation protein
MLRCFIAALFWKMQGISIATVYRTVKLFEEAGILTRHDFGDGTLKI